MDRQPQSRGISRKVSGFITFSGEFPKTEFVTDIQNVEELRASIINVFASV